MFYIAATTNIMPKLPYLVVTTCVCLSVYLSDWVRLCNRSGAVIVITCRTPPPRAQSHVGVGDPAVGGEVFQSVSLGCTARPVGGWVVSGR